MGAELVKLKIESAMPLDTIENVEGYTLRNLGKTNIVLGKNGCGKSTMLRKTEQGLSARTEAFGKTKYITPERGGTLIYQAGVEDNLFRDINWLPNERRKNQAATFRQQSVAQYRTLERVVLRQVESDYKKRKNVVDSSYPYVETFDSYISKINGLLDNIQLKSAEGNAAFAFALKNSEKNLTAEDISSGESELISLAIESLIFSKELTEGRVNVLFLDEPDVHLHPDLQVRFMRFLHELVTKSEIDFRVIIATHSTAILGALESFEDVRLAFMTFGEKVVQFSSITAQYQMVLPVFGAHPLSNVFNQTPLFLVEGEDDERVWQFAVRSSNGSLRLYPVAVDGKENLSPLEKISQNIISAVYDNARAFSLRDRDDDAGPLEDLQHLVRMRLDCRNAENLLLSDEVLSSLGVTWTQLEQQIEAWLLINSDHSHFTVMSEFKDKGFPRKDHDIKEIRNDIMGLIGSNMPWEKAVGRTIGELTCYPVPRTCGNNSIFNYLGKSCSKLFLFRKSHPLEFYYKCLNRKQRRNVGPRNWMP